MITTDDVRKAWLGPSLHSDNFEAWLKGVKSEAWEEGWDAAYHMARCWGHVDGWEAPWPTNPYEGVH